MSVLRRVAEANLPDCWVGAGFIRNAVWDALHGIPCEATRTDIDVVYFDADDDGTRDEIAETWLRTVAPGLLWDVRNQARMHRDNGDQPYASLSDAIAHWPETATAVAAQLRGETVVVLAPCGVEDLLDMVVRPTPSFACKTAIFDDRQRRKNWTSRWPRLRHVPQSATADDR
ncbi:MAG: nucleotidyltransferase family protein [Telmatospirillum sp.]|nr:nucleotidyltransferase family protein [Telmatospirillum sp.]